jgi:hypothetical protein
MKLYYCLQFATIVRKNVNLFNIISSFLKSYWFITVIFLWQIIGKFLVDLGPTKKFVAVYAHAYLRALKGHGNEADFLGFLQKLVPHESLTLPFGRSDFGFEFAETSIFEKRLPAITDTGSYRLSVSLSRGVANTKSRLLNFLKENSLYR